MKTTWAPAGERRLEHLDRADDVHVGVVGRVADRGLHVGLRGEVEDDVGAVEVDAVADVALDERGGAGSRTRACPKERSSITTHVVAARDEGIDEVRADEAGASGDRYTHTAVS